MPTGVRRIVILTLVQSLILTLVLTLILTLLTPVTVPADVRRRIAQKKAEKAAKEAKKYQRQEGEPTEDEDPEIARMRDLRERDEFSARIREKDEVLHIGL